MADKVTWISLRWAGGKHRFQLRFDQHPEQTRRISYLVRDPTLHDRLRAILGRLVSGTWGVEDVSQPIRMGLIGGGDYPGPTEREREADYIAGRSAASWPMVDQLVRNHVLARPLAESVALAQTILIAAIVGVDPALATQGLEPAKLDLEQLTSMEA